MFAIAMNLNVEVCSKIWNRIDIDEVAVQDLLLHVAGLSANSRNLPALVYLQGSI